MKKKNEKTKKDIKYPKTDNSIKKNKSKKKEIKAKK